MNEHGKSKFVAKADPLSTIRNNKLIAQGEKLETVAKLRVLVYINKIAQNPNFAEFLAFLGLFGIGFANLSQKDPSLGKLGHVINPLTPGAFCEKGVSWTFWWFLGWISAKLALIWSKMHLHNNSLAFLPLASRFVTF